MEAVFTPPYSLGLQTPYAGGSKSQHPLHSISLSCPSNSLPRPLSQISTRPRIDFSSIFSTVQPIVDDVRGRGDAAVKEYTSRFDKVDIDKIVVNINELPDPELDDAVQEAFDVAYENIYAFHAAQKPAEGVRCKRVARSIASVGLYVPGGTAVLPSAALMLSVPAQIAGCKTVVLATPPAQDGSICKEVLYHAKKFCVTHILEAGGAQAISAMAWGTKCCPKVNSQIPWADDGKTHCIANLVKRDTGYLPGLLMSQILCAPGMLPRLYCSRLHPSERLKLQISWACGGSHSHGGSGGCSFGNDWCSGSSSRFGGNGGCYSVDRHGHGDYECCNGGSNGGRRGSNGGWHGSNGGWHGSNFPNENSDSSWHKSFFGFPLKIFLLCLLTCLATTSNRSPASFLAFAFGCVYLLTQPSCCQCCNMFKPSVFGTSVYKGACSVMNEGIRFVAVVVYASLVTTITSVVCCASMVEPGIMETNQKLYRTDDSPYKEPPAQSGVRVELPPLKCESLQRLTKPERSRRQTKFLEKVVKVIKAMVVLLESLLSIFTE